MKRQPAQLSLIEVTPEWRIDERTRQIGHDGVASARAAIRTALRRAADTHDAAPRAAPAAPAASARPAA